MRIVYDSCLLLRGCLSTSELGGQRYFRPPGPSAGQPRPVLCDALDIPHIESRVDMEPEMKEFSINLHPSPKIVGSAIRDLIHYLNWTKVAILYEEDMSLISLQELIRPPVKRDLQVIFRKTSVDSFRDTLKDIRSRGSSVSSWTPGHRISLIFYKQ
ncbi:glutamate receptor ionotropic, kainate 1 [Caerostris extrusa]|uniref:Glutamate receptor ionotropic, kainate 1 n=1 Tax=Caerostris extrusa TaxID=172846 RepID=A0AAV4R6H5_CAEEX|nr:glutamate receptor ionotropic, kainate 1 [Caerostris extrusa]